MSRTIRIEPPFGNIQGVYYYRSSDGGCTSYSYESILMAVNTTYPFISNKKWTDVDKTEDQTKDRIKF